MSFRSSASEMAARHMAQAGETRLDEVIEDYLRRREAGEPVSAEMLMQDHAELMPELKEVLRRLELVEAARRAAGTAETVQLDVKQLHSTTGNILVRCPHCRQLNHGKTSAVEGGVRCAVCEKRFRFLDSDEFQTLPETLGRFELLTCVGMGGFGTVWKAHDRQLDRIVAIKMPRTNLAGSRVKDLLQEARIAAQLKHPHIVDVYEVGTEGDAAYIVSDFIEGSSLDAYLNEKPLAFDEVAQLMLTVTRAVQHAHEAGIVHRDLKPGNILIDSNGTPHVTDFGLAKFDAEDVTVTLDGRILGTPAYMSPEQALGHSHQVDARGDVYSLGVILFQLLTGELPFRGQTAMLIHQVIHEEPPSPRHLNAYVPRDLETIVLKCLEKDPQARYGTARDLADELQRFLDGEPLEARPVGRLQRYLRWCHRNPRLFALAASTLFSLLLLLAAGWWAYFDEARDRRDLLAAKAELLASLQQEDMIRQAYLQTEDFRGHRETLEAVAADPEFRAVLQAALADPELAALRKQLNHPSVDRTTPEWRAKQAALTQHPARRMLQQELQRRAASHADVFAWMILDPDGLQLARSPADQAFGRNYSWRTYYHGGPRDFRDRADYLAHHPGGEQHIKRTELSRGLFTDATHRYVVVISTPLYENNKFLGVLGVMVNLKSFTRP